MFTIKVASPRIKSGSLKVLKVIYQLINSSFDFSLSSHTNLPCENCCFVGCSLSMRQKDNGMLDYNAVYKMIKLLNEGYLMKLH